MTKSAVYRLLPPDDYLKSLIKSIKSSRNSVSMVALVISEDNTTRKLIDALCDASRRGVKVDIGLDIYFTYLELEKNFSRWSYLRRQVKNMRATRNRLKKAGVKVRWLGQFGLTFFSRRTHIKWSIIDDVVYSFGGVNLYASGIESVDYMFRIKSKDLAQQIAAEHRRVISSDRSGHGYRSHLFGTARHTILIDGGKMFDSIIYRHALSYASEASKIIYVSQYCPNGKLLRILKDHPDSKLYFNHWQHAPSLLNRILLRWSTWRGGVQTLYTKPQYLHAKFMIFYMPNGETIAITGSHNFVETGTWLGTREVALETTDNNIIRQLTKFLDHHIKS